ncbi:hypothetical protein B5F40_14150 [Gordonibacter sp. An230]|nr:hypothetical protein B5F40_14150 [Gordonibacter sp. An230]
MSESCRIVPPCPHAEALVVIEVLPLCSLDSPEGSLRAAALAQELSSPQPSDASGLCEGRPLRTIAALSCEDALALLKEAGHVRL